MWSGEMDYIKWTQRWRFDIPQIKDQTEVWVMNKYCEPVNSPYNGGGFMAEQNHPKSCWSLDLQPWDCLPVYIRELT